MDNTLLGDWCQMNRYCADSPTAPRLVLGPKGRGRIRPHSSLRRTYGYVSVVAAGVSPIRSPVCLARYAVHLTPATYTLGLCCVDFFLRRRVAHEKKNRRIANAAPLAPVF